MTSTSPHAQASDKSSSQGTPHIPSESQASEPDIPPQRHAGKVGYGPNYDPSSTLEDKVIGLKEELLGKITHNPERFQHGKEVLTGEERRKKLVGSDEPSPFKIDKDDKSDNESQNQQRAGSQSRSE